MSMTIYTGRVNKGNIPNVEYMSDQTLEILGEIRAGNTTMVQSLSILNSVLAPMEREVPRKDGSPLPVKIHNAKFTEGKIQTSAPEFRPYIDKFEMRKVPGYNTMAFDYDDETILEADNNSIDLNAKALEQLRGIRTVYANKYLPFQRLKAIITGSTLVATAPITYGEVRSGSFLVGTEYEIKEAGTTDFTLIGAANSNVGTIFTATGVGTGTGLAEVTASGFYTSQYGFARGEDYADFLTVTDGVTTRNHMRTITTTALTSTDITNLIDDIEDTNMYTGQGVIVLGHPRTIQNIASLSSAPENKDIAIFGEITEAYGATFKKVPGFHKDFLIFLDMGMMKELLVRGVEVDPSQRGWGLVYKNDIKAFNSVTDIQGAKVRVFPEEWYMTLRLSGGILDTNTSRYDASGYMQDGTGKSIEALNSWVSTMTNYFKYID